MTAQPGLRARGAGQTERATLTPAARVKTACATISGCLPSTWNVGASARFVNTSLGVSAEIDDGVGTYFVRDPRGGLLLAAALDEDDGVALAADVVA